MVQNSLGCGAAFFFALFAAFLEDVRHVVGRLFQMDQGKRGDMVRTPYEHDEDHCAHQLRIPDYQYDGSGKYAQFVDTYDYEHYHLGDAWL